MLAYSYVHKYGYKYDFEFDDAVSIAFFGLTKAAASFDSSKNTKFSTYAFICIATEFKMECRYKNKYNKLNIAKSLQDTYVTDSGKVITVEQTIPDTTNKIELVEIVEQLKWAYNQLTSKEKQVILLFYKYDYKQREIANICNLSQSYVSRIINKFRKLI